MIPQVQSAACPRPGGVVALFRLRCPAASIPSPPKSLAPVRSLTSSAPAMPPLSLRLPVAPHALTRLSREGAKG